MQQLDSDLWVSDSSLRFVGVDIGARMTVVRLSDSKLLLHSPIAATEELVSEVKALGDVAYLVAPNLLHHLFLADWQEAFPNASLYGPPGLIKKRTDLSFTGVLGDQPEAAWADTLDQVFVEGFKFANEVDFFHKPSKTLILTDLAFNVGPHSPWLTRFGFRLLRAYGRLTPTILEKLLVRDRPAFRKSLERILEWPFERVVVAHGAVKETGGREELEQGYSWVLR